MNAKEEFVAHIKDRDVKCASVIFGNEYDDDREFINLKCGHTETEYNTFLESLNFEYDNGYGGQELFGFIWYEDGTWSDRGEYDGAEWWQYQACPDIPEELK